MRRPPFRRLESQLESFADRADGHLKTLLLPGPKVSLDPFDIIEIVAGDYSDLDAVASGRDRKCPDETALPAPTLETFAQKRAVLLQHCDAVGRDPAEILKAVNVGLAWSEESLRQQFGGLADYVRPGVLTGSDAEVIDRIGAYVEAGAGQVNLALRAPFDEDALDRFAAALGVAV